MDKVLALGDCEQGAERRDILFSHAFKSRLAHHKGAEKKEKKRDDMGREFRQSRREQDCKAPAQQKVKKPLT